MKRVNAKQLAKKIGIEWFMCDMVRQTTALHIGQALLDAGETKQQVKTKLLKLCELIIDEMTR